MPPPHGGRYLVIHDDSIARPDMHTGVAGSDEGVFLLLSQFSGVKVVRLW